MPRGAKAPLQRAHPGGRDEVFRLPSAQSDDPAVSAWFAADTGLRFLVGPWFARIRACGSDSRELIHDGRPTACVTDAAFAYVDAFANQASIGFFNGAALADPAGLLEGSGKRMRHVKLRLGEMPDEIALTGLIEAAYKDMKSLFA